MNLFHYVLNLVKFSSQANEVIKTRFRTFPKIFFLLLQAANVCYGKDSYYLTALVNSDLDSYIHFVGTKSQNTRLANRWTTDHLTFSPASVTAVDMDGLTPFYPDDYTSAKELTAQELTPSKIYRGFK